MRLRELHSLDTLSNETRRRGKSWGRWIYLGLVAAFFFWIFDLFFGELVYFRADGLVLRDRIALATQYPASIKELRVEEGDEIKAGDAIAALVSQNVEETLAKLSTDMANVLTRSTQLAIRKNVIDATSPLVAQRLKEARSARVTSEDKSLTGLYTVERRYKLVENEIASASAEAETKAEARIIASDLPRLRAAVDTALQAMSRLKDLYADGRVVAPVDGVVGRLYVSKGSVVKPGDSMMDLYHGVPYVLAAVPEGALYTVECGDRIRIKVGFKSYTGHIAKIYPVTAPLPQEFRDALRQIRRAQMVRVEFEPDQDFPTLFARTELSAADWPPQWMSRMWNGWLGNRDRAASGRSCSEAVSPRASR
jgi:multidrug resistance efflux pump